MDFIPYKINEALSYKFYTIPMELFFNEKYINLSLEAKILYGIMLSVLTLSIKNNWKDENNNVYIILTRETIQKMLHEQHLKLGHYIFYLSRQKFLYHLLISFVC